MPARLWRGLSSDSQQRIGASLFPPFEFTNWLNGALFAAANFSQSFTADISLCHRKVRKTFKENKPHNLRLRQLCACDYNISLKNFIFNLWK